MNILVIGNGFDLAHDLPTRYQDFLGFVERFLNIINTPQILQQGGLNNAEKSVYEYINHLIFSEQKLCKELEQLVKEDRKSTRLNSSHTQKSRMPSSA